MLTIKSCFFFQDGTNSVLTSVFKVAILPRHLLDMAAKTGKLYEEGELVPQSSSKKRKRKTISSS